MFRKRSSSNRVSSFRPTLEVLEDRTVPSPIGNLLFQYESVIGQNLEQADHLRNKMNDTEKGFVQNPNPGTFITFAVNILQYQNAVILASQQHAMFSQVEHTVKISGQLSQVEANVLDGIESVQGDKVGDLQKVLNLAMGDLVAAFFALVTGGTANLTPLSTAQIDSFTVPGSAPHDGGSVTASAVISGGIDTPVTLSVSGSDGFSDSTTRAIFGTGVIALSVPPGGKGVVDTWTVSVQGGPSQSLTTTYT